jgi:hypothetical protein
VASGLYYNGRRQFARGEINWSTGDTFRCILVDTGTYTVDLVNHDYYNDISAGARVGTAQTLSGLGVATNGACYANNATFADVTGNSVEAVAIYKWSGSEASSTLIGWVEFSTTKCTGGNIIIEWDTGTNRIFRI